MPHSTLFEIADAFRAGLPASAAGVAFAGPVPADRLRRAIGTFAAGADPNWTAVLVDESDSGDGTRGLVVTADALYASGVFMPAISLPLDEVVSASSEGRILLVNGRPFYPFEKLDAEAAEAVARAASGLAELRKAWRNPPSAEAGPSAVPEPQSRPDPQARPYPQSRPDPQARPYPQSRPGSPALPDPSARQGGGVSPAARAEAGTAPPSGPQGAQAPLPGRQPAERDGRGPREECPPGGQAVSRPGAAGPPERSEAKLLQGLSAILAGAKSVWVKPDIPPAKLDGALGSYARGVGRMETLFLVDSTRLGSAEDGLLATRGAAYAKESGSPPACSPLGPGVGAARAVRAAIAVGGSYLADLGRIGETRAAAVARALNFLGGIEEGASGAIPPADDGPDPEAGILFRLASIFGKLEKAWVKPGIRPKRLEAALGSYAFGARMDDVLFLVDSSLLGGGGSGILATRDKAWSSGFEGKPAWVSFAPPHPNFSTFSLLNEIHCYRPSGARKFAGTGELGLAYPVAATKALNYLVGLWARVRGLELPPKPGLFDKLISKVAPDKAAFLPPPGGIYGQGVADWLAGLLSFVPGVGVYPDLPEGLVSEAVNGYAWGTAPDEILFIAASANKRFEKQRLLATRDRVFFFQEKIPPVCAPFGPPVPEVAVDKGVILFNGYKVAELSSLEGRDLEKIAEALRSLAGLRL
ncbi:MAG: hypothetical protein LBQ12_02220 [Deltaproteobacteria bacterium]|jgi:hypothetical protein|nr:hypothetical protein [Deltaproteobacteria bacterium]